MKKILVTGSNGLLGQKLVELLLDDKSVQLIACSKGNNRLKNHDNYVYEELDICNEKELRRIFLKYSPDSIINTAAMTRVDYCEENRTACRNINVNAVKFIVKLANKIGAHLIHLSSDFVFDGKNGPYKEEDKVSPPSLYGLTKLDGERIITDMSKYWSIIRTILVYGVNKDMSRTNIVKWIKDSMEEGKEIRIVKDQFRMPTLVDDLAMACINIARKRSFGLYHISGNEMMSIYDLSIRVANFFNLDKSLIIPVSTSELDEKAKRPPKTGFILDKAIKDLDYSPHTFEEGLGKLKMKNYS